MTTLHFCLGALLLVPPQQALAQNPDPTPAAAPRFYVGLAAYHSNFQNLASWRQGDAGFRVPVQLTAGYQLRPRLALELGVAYSGRTTTYTYDGLATDAAGNGYHFQYSNTNTVRVAAVSALARYALTRQPAHRLQVAALGGFTLVHANFYSRGAEIDYQAANSPIVPYTVSGSNNDLLLTAGLGLSYRLCPRFALNFDITTNRNLSHPETYNGYTGSAALGLRYRFGH